MKQQLFFKILELITGGVFLFSALSKLADIEATEIFIENETNLSLTQIGYFSRLLIWIELVLGILFIAGIFRNPLYKFSILLLIIFSFYLFWKVLIIGNANNCGCFGTAIVISPYQAIVKNVLLILLICLLYKYATPVLKQIKFQKILLLIVMIFPLSYIAISAPHPSWDKSFYSIAETNRLPLEIIDGKIKYDTNIKKGKWITVFLSLTCSHCKKAAQKLAVIKKHDPSLPVYFFLNGEDSLVSRFISENKCDNVPYVLFNGAEQFLQLSGSNLPAIYLLNNSIAEQKIRYSQIDENTIVAWTKSSP